MPFTTEIFIFPTSEAARANPNIVVPAFDIGLEAKGINKPLWHGLQIENPETGYIFINWDSYEDHEAAMKSAFYPALREALRPALSGEEEMYHVEFSAETIAFESPVTEILVLTLKAPENRDTVEEILSKISDATQKKLVFGKTREDENKYIVIGGWKTVQDHWDTVAKPASQNLYSLASKDHLYHTKLSKYPF